jgi:hypothetical protein
MNPLHLQDLTVWADRGSTTPSMRDPDGLLSGPGSMPPDPLGRVYIRVLTALGDWISERRESLRRPGRTHLRTAPHVGTKLAESE